MQATSWFRALAKLIVPSPLVIALLIMFHERSLNTTNCSQFLLVRFPPKCFHWTTCVCLGCSRVCFVIETWMAMPFLSCRRDCSTGYNLFNVCKCDILLWA